MKIEIESGAGFCFGVRKAIETAEKHLNEEEGLKSLGEIVHNDEEINRLLSRGLTNIKKEEIQNLSEKTILIRTHGEPPSTYDILRKNNNKIIDATCPVVLKLQERIRNSFLSMKEIKGQIVIIGKKGHAEVIGLAGQTDNEAIIVSTLQDIDLININYPVEIFSQTTFPVEDFKLISDGIIKIAQNTVKVHDTICRQVSNRVPRLKEFSKEHDIILFVSGKNSSNGKLLYNEALRINPRSYFITSPEEIQEGWFIDFESIGISGATSTPQWLMENVRQHVITILNIKE